jgi:hypothetical protein
VDLKTHFAVATIAAAGAFFAEVIPAGIFGATHADAGGSFLANAALKIHHDLFYLPGLRDKLVAAPLRFGVGDFVVLLTLIGQIDGVLLKLFTVGDVFSARTVEEFGEGGILVFAQAFLKRAHGDFEELDAKENAEEIDEFVGSLSEGASVSDQSFALLFAGLPLGHVSFGGTFLHPIFGLDLIHHWNETISIVGNIEDGLRDGWQRSGGLRVEAG